MRSLEEGYIEEEIKAIICGEKPLVDGKKAKENSHSCIKFLMENNLLSYEDLRKKTQTVANNFNQLSVQIKATEKRMTEIGNLKTHIATLPCLLNKKRKHHKPLNRPPKVRSKNLTYGRSVFFKW